MNFYELCHISDDSLKSDYYNVNIEVQRDALCCHGNTDTNTSNPKGGVKQPKVPQSHANQLPTHFVL